MDRAQTNWGMLLISAGFCVWLSLTFAKPFFNQLSFASHWKTILCFVQPRMAKSMVRHHQMVFDDKSRTAMREIQQLVPAGEKIWVWSIVGGVHWDYQRNPISHFEVAGLNAPWTDVPLNPDASKALRDYFYSKGIRYVIWQNRGYGIRSDKMLWRSIPTWQQYRKFRRLWYFVRIMTALSQDEQIIRQKANHILLRLGAESDKHRAHANPERINHPDPLELLFQDSFEH